MSARFLTDLESDGRCRGIGTKHETSILDLAAGVKFMDSGTWKRFSPYNLSELGGKARKLRELRGAL
jgi:hypothetical protein